jgi:hypothetical protein
MKIGENTDDVPRTVIGVALRRPKHRRQCMAGGDGLDTAEDNGGYPRQSRSRSFKVTSEDLDSDRAEITESFSKYPM